MNQRTKQKHKNMNVTHQQIVAGETTAGPLAILLSRFILWMGRDSLALELKVSMQETRAIKQRFHDAETELTNLKASLEAVWTTEWKTTKDGRRRYRKVARKMVVNRWTTESEEIDEIPF